MTLNPTARAALDAVGDVLDALIPKSLSPFMTKETRDMAAGQAIRRLGEKGWVLMTQAEYTQLIAMAADARQAKAEALRALKLVQESRKTDEEIRDSMAGQR